MKTTRTRALVIGLAMACLVGLVATTVLPSGASLPSAVRLHLGTDARSFQYGATTQSLTTAKNGCQLVSAEPIIDLSSTGSQSSPGLASDGIGVKATRTSSNGTPCSQVDAAESLRLAAGPALGSRQFSRVRLDLEMTGNAVVKLTLASSSRTVVYHLQTGTSITADQTAEAGYDTVAPYLVRSEPGDDVDACASPSNSGPNNAGSDNCQWTVDPGFNFDLITLTTLSGAVSLEGGGDFGNDPAFDTMLYLSNTAPVANHDSFNTDEDVAAEGNVLDNDTDSEGDTLSATLLTNPSNGTVQLAPGGGFTYEPTADWSGTDSFTYSTSDGSASAQATATIVVQPINDAPVPISGSANVAEDATVTITVATDIDSTGLDANCTSSDGGVVTDGGDGTVTFAPPADFNGTIVLTCSATDDGGASTASTAIITVGVTPVNDAPVAVDDEADVNAGDSVTIDVLSNDSDVDGDPLDATDISSVSPEGATAQVNGDGTISYTPPAGYDGPGSFTYRASDGDLDSEPATVDVSVFPVICSSDTVSDTDGDVSASFTRLSDPFECKRYAIEASDVDDAVLFQPQGLATAVFYRGVLTLGPDAAPAPTGSGAHALLLRYDPTGRTSFQPVRWCIDPQFDGQGQVSGATLPAGETWCIASAQTRGTAVGDLLTVWQVYGEDDPRFTR